MYTVLDFQMIMYYAFIIKIREFNKPMYYYTHIIISNDNELCDRTWTSQSVLLPGPCS